ncbi:NADH-quinone oxidoreductase subunit L, partial [candidate division KSB1 bacterium]
ANSCPGIYNMITLAIIIWLLPLLAFVIQIFFGKRLPRQGDWLVVGSMFTGLILSTVIFAKTMLNYDPHFREVLQFNWIVLGETTFPLGFVVDNVTAVMLMVVTFVSSFVFLFSVEYMKGDPRYSRFFAYLSIFAFSMLGLVLFENLFGIYMCWELVGLSSYLLIGFWFEKDTAADACKKAFITNRFGDFGMFLGMLIIFTALGTFSLEGIKEGIEAGHLGGSLLTVAGILLFMGAIGKSAQFPLHVWLPDAMEGPTPVSALIHAATMVAAGVYLVVRIFFMLTPDSMLFIAYVGGFTAFLSATIAVAQNDIKRVLAYSTVSQLGYMMLALGCGAYAAGLFHLTTHAFFKALLFLGSGSVIHSMHHALHSVHDHSDPQDMNNMGGLRKKMPVTFTTMFIATLAISGVPFTSGFLSKDSILAGTLHFTAQNPQHFILAFFGFGAAAITAFYMFRLIFKTFFGEFAIKKAWDHFHESGKAITIPLVALVILCFFMFYSFNPLTPSEGWFYHLIQPPEQVGIISDAGHNGNGGELLAVQAEAEHGSEGAHDPTHTWALFLSLIVAATGIFISFKTYYTKRISADKWAENYPVLYKCLFNKWYFDEIYENTLIKGTLLWTGFCGWFDLKVIDGFVNFLGRITVIISWLSGLFDKYIVDGLVNGVANITQIFGWFFRQFQTGRIQNYLVAVLIAMIMIILFRVF